MIFERLFLPFLHKIYVVGAHWNCLGEAILMSTHNIGFLGTNKLNHFLIVIKYHQIGSVSVLL